MKKKKKKQIKNWMNQINYSNSLMKKQKKMKLNKNAKANTQKQKNKNDQKKSNKAKNKNKMTNLNFLKLFLTVKSNFKSKVISRKISRNSYSFKSLNYLFL